MRTKPTPRTLLGLSLGLGLTLGLAEPAAALRCRQRVVSSGDSQTEVRARCGEPTTVETRTEEVQSVQRDPDGEVVRIDVTQIVLHVWTYDFGPNRLMVELVFRDGRLESETTLGYGTEGHAPADGPPPRR